MPVENSGFHGTVEYMIADVFLLWQLELGNIAPSDGEN